MGSLEHHNPGLRDPCYGWWETQFRVALMSNTTDPAARQSPWLGIVKFLLLVILIAIIFVLGEQMVHHRFFRGGYIDQRGILKP